MKAIRLAGRGGPHHLVYEDAPQPRPGAEEVLVRVYATGVIANELKWDVTYQTKAGSPRALPIPGRDLSGVVEAVGHGVTEPAKATRSMPCWTTAAMGPRRNLPLPCPISWPPNHARPTM